MAQKNTMQARTVAHADGAFIMRLHDAANDPGRHKCARGGGTKRCKAAHKS